MSLSLTKSSNTISTSDGSPFFSPESNYSSELSPHLESNQTVTNLQFTPPYQPSVHTHSLEEKGAPAHSLRSPIFLYEPSYTNYTPFLKITENKALYLVYIFLCYW
jgi:hypothetical protein